MREGSPSPHPSSVTCNVSFVTCHVSHVMCHLSHVMCHFLAAPSSSTRLVVRRSILRSVGDLCEKVTLRVSNSNLNVPTYATVVTVATEVTVVTVVTVVTNIARIAQFDFCHNLSFFYNLSY